jgi:uncharacterized membrane protein
MEALQRFSYVAFALTIAHGVAYQLIENRRVPWVMAFGTMVIIGLAIQASGFSRLRSKEK